MRLNDARASKKRPRRVWVGELLPVKEPVLAGMRGQNLRPVAVPGRFFGGGQQLLVVPKLKLSNR